MPAALHNVDKITIVSTGTMVTPGCNKITGDMTEMAAQIPALFETLSGMKMSDLLANVTKHRSRQHERETTRVI